MSKAVKLNTNGRVEIVDVPKTSSLLSWMYEQIGCSCVENVYPRGLEDPYMMIVDEEGLFQDRPMINFLASWYYKTQEHGQPIVGIALIMKKVWTDDGPDIGGLEDAEALMIARKTLDKLPEAYMKIRQRMGEKIV